MATDNSPPRIRIVLTVAFSSLVILVALNYVFRSYFLMMTEEVEHGDMALLLKAVPLLGGDRVSGAFVLIRDVIEDELEQAVSGKVAPKAALDSAVRRGNEILRRFEKANP